MQLIRAMQDAIAEEQKPVVVFAREMVFAAEKSPAESLPHEVFWAHNGRHSDTRLLLLKTPGFCGLLAWGHPDSGFTEGDMVFDFAGVVY